MPEGDTIYRTAERLRQALHGDIVTGFATSLPAVAARAVSHPVVGRRITAVTPRGKHLLIALSPADAAVQGPGWGAGDLVLHTHLRMTGSWHLYRPGERWGKPAEQAVVTLSTQRFTAPCFSAPVVELLSAAVAARHPSLNRLGPDAITPDFDPVVAAARLGTSPAPIGVAILDQSLVAGAGNVYKSEVLFLERIDPFIPAASLPATVLESLAAHLHRLMMLNREAGVRRTSFSLDPGRKLWVYGRAGEPCLVCGDLVRARRQGEHARTTYYCPTCQG